MLQTTMRRTTKLFCIWTFLTFWSDASANIYNSYELINDTIVGMRATEAYEDLQSIMVKFVMHFEFNETMTVETGHGKREIERTEEILQFDDFLIYATVDSENARQALIDKSFQYDYPLNAFKFIRNNTVVLQNVVNKMLSTFEHYMDKERADLTKAIKKVIENPPFPTKHDLNAAKRSLIQLQDIYELKSSEIAAGEVLGERSQWLTGEECMELSAMAKQMGHSEKQISWLQTAQPRMATTEDMTQGSCKKQMGHGENTAQTRLEEAQTKMATNKDMTRIYSQLYDAYSSHGCQCTEESIAVRNKLISLLPDIFESHPNECVEVTKETCLDKLAKINKGVTEPPNDLESKFKHLCQEAANRVNPDETDPTGEGQDETAPIGVAPDKTGPSGVDPDETAPAGAVSSGSTHIKIRSIDLFCYYSKTSHPFYYIHPFKAEILNLQPRIEIIHDFLKESENNLLIQHGKSNILAENKAKKPTNLQTLQHKVRTTSTTLKSSKQQKLVTRIQRRVAAVSNSDRQSFGQFYLTNYGIGGYDEIPINKMNENEYKRNSQVSVTVFLSNVAKGGEVVFPNLGISVKPVDKMALVVYGTGSDITGSNITGSDFKGSDITVHGACPVVKGNKWIVTMDG